MTTTSFEKIYSKYYSSVLNSINFRVHNLTVAEDITADVFVKVYKHLADFDSTKSALGTWIRNISNNSVIDYFRAEKNNKLKISTTDICDEDGKEYYQFVSESRADLEVDRNEFMSNVGKAFRTLRPNYRKVAVLYFLRDKPYNEIAEICNIPLGSVKGMIARCRAKLQVELKEESRVFSIG